MELRETLIKLEERFGPGSIIKDVELDRHTRRDHQMILSDLITHLTERKWSMPTDYAVQFKPNGIACLYELDANDCLKTEPTYKVYPSVRYLAERN